jgi:hypothetical protein
MPVPEVGIASWRVRSEVAEPGEDVGLGTIGSWRGVGRAGAVDGGLFDRHVGMQVSVGTGSVLVSQPERDDCDIDPAASKFMAAVCGFIVAI